MSCASVPLASTEASKTLMDYAKERLEKEIDVVVLRRLDESIELAAQKLNLPLDSPAHFVNPANTDGICCRRESKGSHRRSDATTSQRLWD